MLTELGLPGLEGELPIPVPLMRVSQSQESGSNTAAGSHGRGGSGRTSCGAAGTWLLRAFVFAELPESWADMQEPLLEGMCFTLKYLGMTLVEKPKGEDMAAAAIRRIVATVRPSPGALGCWGQSPAPALQESVCVLALNSSEGLCPSQEEGGMQEAARVCLCAVGKLSSCRTAPATCSTPEPGWEQSCACHSTEKRVTYWERWGLPLLVCVTVV